MSVMSKLRATMSLALLTLALTHGAAGRQADARRPYRLSLPGEDWALDIDLSAFNLPTSNGQPAVDLRRFPIDWYKSATEGVSRDAKELLLTTHERTDGKSRTALTLNVKFAPAQAPGTAADFRDFAIRRVTKNLPDNARLTGGGPKTSEYKGIPLARYAFSYEITLGTSPMRPIPVYSSGPRTMEAYIVKDDTWITLTLTADGFGEREEKLFDSLLDSLNFADTSAPGSSFDYYHKGRALYLAGEYRKAVSLLGVALSLEHKQRQLDATSWRNLVSNLIDSLGEVGDMARAKQVLDYAAEQDPASAPFQLALARYYAKRDDLDNALAHLEKAYRNAGADGSATPLSDPKDDPAFARFKNDERFRKALKALKK